MAGVVGAVTELLCRRVDDNLAIPLMVGGAVYVVMHFEGLNSDESPPVEVAWAPCRGASVGELAGPPSGSRGRGLQRFGESHQSNGLAHCARILPHPAYFTQHWWHGRSGTSRDRGFAITALSPGQHVLLPVRGHPWAEKTVVKAVDCIPLPDSVDPSQACMIRINALTAQCCSRSFAY